MMIDLTAIAALADLQKPGKPSLLERIVGLFEQNSPDLISEIEAAEVSGDKDSARAAAHSLKSSSAYLGAGELSELCKTIEHCARTVELTECTAEIKRLRDCYEESMDELRSFMDKAA